MSLELEALDFFFHIYGSRYLNINLEEKKKTTWKSNEFLLLFKVSRQHI
jgi:hypothetical protein